MDFITRYKLFENVQQSKKILKELNIPETNEEYVELREILKRNIGYLGKFTEWLFNYDISLEELEELYKKVREIRKLDKPLDSFESPYELLNYIKSRESDMKLNQIIKSIPSRNRRLVNQKLKDFLLKNIEYSEYIKDLYSKKSGGYRSVDDFIKLTSRNINNIKSGWTAEAIKYEESEVVYRDNITLILDIPNYERSCVLGTTYWCISTNERHWDKHTTDFNKQYFIYDFSETIGDKRSLIGVTIQPDGSIESSHYRDNTELKNHDEIKDLLKFLLPSGKSDILSRMEPNDIIGLSKYGFTDEIRNLINKGVDPSIKNGIVIINASSNGHTDLVEMLLSDVRIDPSIDDNTPIQNASLNGHIDIVKLLLNDSRLSIGSSLDKSVDMASRNGHIDIVKLLLSDPRIDPSANKNSAILYASGHNHINIVKLLLNDTRVDPSDNDNSAIQWVSKDGHIDIVKLLLSDERVDPSTPNNQSIQLAFSGDYINIVKLLLGEDTVINSLSKIDLDKYMELVNI